MLAALKNKKSFVRTQRLLFRIQNERDRIKERRQNEDSVRWRNILERYDARSHFINRADFFPLPIKPLGPSQTR